MRIISFASIVLLAISCHAQTTALTGLAETAVSVLWPEGTENARKDIQTDTELKLRGAGIRVVTLHSTPLTPTLSFRYQELVLDYIRP